MLCYRDRSYCSANCGNLDCDRNTRTIDGEHFAKVGLSLGITDFSQRCGEFKEVTDATPAHHQAVQAEL